MRILILQIFGCAILTCNVCGQFIYNVPDVQRCEYDTVIEKLFILTEEMPIPNKTIDELDLLLSSQIDFASIEYHNGDSISVGITLNCEGDYADFIIHRDIDSSLCMQIVKLLLFNVEWSVAKQSGNTVDIRLWIPFTIYNDELKIISLPNNPATHKKRRKRIKRNNAT